MRCKKEKVGNFKKIDYFQGDPEPFSGIGRDLRLIDHNSYWNPSGEPFIADATVAVFLIKGSVELQVNMVDYRVSAPAMLITLEGMVVRHGRCSEDTQMDIIVISKSLTDDILSEGNVSFQLRQLILQSPVFPIAGHNVILRSFNFLLRVLVRDRSNPYRVEAVRYMTLTLFCGFALNRMKDGQEKTLSRKETLARQYIREVRQNYRVERTVAWYADRLCVTPKYLSMVVKDATGKPALDWIDEFIIVESKALLKSTDLSLEQIAGKLSFGSAALFSKYFKRVTGLSPRRYRNSGRGVEAEE